MAAILKGDLVADGSVPYEHGSVAYRDFGGQGPAVMLVHGLGGNLAHWGRVAPLLQGRYRLIAIDLPSHGASTAPAVYSFDHDLGAVDKVRQKPGAGSARSGRALLRRHARGLARRQSPRPIPGGSQRRRPPVRLDSETEPESQTEELPEEALVNEGDAEWLEAEVNREVEEAASIGLRLDRDGEMVRRAFQPGDDGRWHRSPTLSRFLEIAHVLDALDLMPAYTASSCRTVTVLADIATPLTRRRQKLQAAR